MPIAETDWTTTNVGFITSTTNFDSGTDPAGKIHTQLVNFLAETTGDTFTILRSPRDCTALNSTTNVAWLLKSTMEGTGNTNYGFIFMDRDGSSGSGTGVSGWFYNWSSGTANNNLGSYTSGSAARSNLALTSTVYWRTLYNTDGPLPYFIVAATTDILGTSPELHILLKVDNSNISPGSFYPSSGLGKWVYLHHTGAIGAPNDSFIATPALDNNAPFKGIIGTNKGTINLNFPTSSNYFFRLNSTSFYGSAHYLGTCTNNILLSHTTTGGFGDTVTIDGITYRSFMSVWAKIS